MKENNAKKEKITAMYARLLWRKSRRRNRSGFTSGGRERGNVDDKND